MRARRDNTPLSGKSPVALIAFVSVVSLQLVAGADTGSTSSPLARCDGLVRDNPAAGSSYRCFLEVARGDGSFPQAARRLEAIRARDADNPNALRWLAQIEADQGRDRARLLYRLAAETFGASGSSADEVETRAALARFLHRRGARDDARRQLAKARAEVERTGDPVARGWLAIAEAQDRVVSGDYGAAKRHLEAVEDQVFSDTPLEQRASWLVQMGNISWYLGDLDATERHYRLARDFRHEARDIYSEARVLTNLVLVADNRGRPLEERESLAREALQTALAGGNLGAAGRAHAYLGTLLTPEKAEQKIAHTEKALELSRSVEDAGGIYMALRSLAEALADSDPDRAVELLQEAIGMARRTGDRAQEARNRVILSRLLWKLGPRSDAIVASLEALASIEATRDLQPDSEARARRFRTWNRPYQELVDHLLSRDLLAPGDETTHEDLDLAFRVTERARARVLLEELDVAHATVALSREGESREAWNFSLKEISRLQSRLKDLGLGRSERDLLLQELEAREREEVVLRAKLARDLKAFGAVRTPQLATLREVQEALAENQALISFWLPDRAGRNFKSFIVSENSVELCQTPTPGEIDEVASLYLGLIERGDHLADRGGSKLYHLVLECPLGRLPAGIQRLVIVPHGNLNRLPLHALRPTPDGAPIGSRFEIVTVPSASVWLRLRSLRPPPAGSVLAIADPELNVGTGRSTSRPSDARAYTFTKALALGPLPRARREARSVLRNAGRDSFLLIGESATERFLKQTDLTQFSVLHFAAHALNDNQHPDRSAIVLAPGALEEDGLLQLREIVGLKLSGQVVVLSACQSASGAAIYNEGVLSLARGFFVAGARTVVGSLWPLRDADAAALMGELYHELGDGKSVAAALSSVQRRWMAGGEPPAAWAGLVALGDGDVVPLPGERIPWRPRAWFVVAIAVIGIVGLPMLGLKLFRRF